MLQRPPVYLHATQFQSSHGWPLAPGSKLLTSARQLSWAHQLELVYSLVPAEITEKISTESLR